MEKVLDAIEDAAVSALEEVSGELEARCGNIADIGKQVSGVSNTSVHGALTELDGWVQDHVTRALLDTGIDLGFLVEEDTALLRGHKGNPAELAAIFDPIDGTLSYIRGQHDYSSMFAISHKGRIVMGILGFFHPFRCMVGRVDRPRSVASQSQSEPLVNRRIACHYRLYNETYRPTLRALTDAGYVVIPAPLDLNVPEHQPFSWAAAGHGLGSNGAAVDAMLEGRWDAYIGPHVNLHDFVGPWGVAEANGAVGVKLRTPDESNANTWVAENEASFLVTSRSEYPKRYRLMIARGRRIAEELSEVLATATD